MLILLGVSTVLAVVTPDPRDRDPQEETTTPTGPTGATGSGGPDEPEERDPSLAVMTVEAPTKKEPVPVAMAEASGRLVLTVATGGPADISIPDFGLTEPATEYAPAVFDLVLPTEAGTFEVVDVESGDTVAEIKTRG
jgi:hypothetical protein